MVDYSQYGLDGIGLENLPDIPMLDDVRELIITTWALGRPYFFNDYQSYFSGNPIREYRTFYKPFLASSNSDGSYNINVRYRAYQLAGDTELTYTLIDYYNNDPKNSAPKLIKPNIAVIMANGGDYNLLFNDPYQSGYFNGAPSNSDYQYSIRAVYNSNLNIIFPNRTIYYTLDGSDPTENSNVYDPNNLPILLANNTYTVKVLSKCPGWQDSDIQSDTIIVNNLFKYNFALLPEISLSGALNFNPSNNTYILNSDCLFTGYEDISLALSLPVDNDIGGSTTRKIYYSTDVGITYQEYTNPIPLPIGWKTPVGNAGFPTILFNLKDDVGNRSAQIEGSLSVLFLYPNWNLNVFAYVFNINSPYIGEAISINGNTFTFGPTNFVLNVGLNILQNSRTILNDYRYFELKVNNITDLTKSIRLYINEIQLDQNGYISNTFSTTGSQPGNQDGQYNNLAWTTGDVIRIRFNYGTGNVELAINNNQFSPVFLTTVQQIDVRIGYSNFNGDVDVNNTSFTFNLKESEFIYPINDGITLPLDTSN